MTTSARKTAPQGRIPSYYEFATHRSIYGHSVDQFQRRSTSMPAAAAPHSRVEAQGGRSMRRPPLATGTKSRGFGTASMFVAATAGAHSAQASHRWRGAHARRRSRHALAALFTG